MTLQDDLKEAMSHHKNTESLAINNTFIRRMLTLLALKTTAKLNDRDGTCVPISKLKIVKFGIWEAATMKYVAETPRFLSRKYIARSSTRDVHTLLWRESKATYSPKRGK